MNKEGNPAKMPRPAAVDSEKEASAERITPKHANEAVIRAVSSWKGVSVHDHRFGGVEFRLGRRELGHLHGTFADLPFRWDFRDEMVASGRAKPHHVLPDSGWVTAPMRSKQEVENVIDLFRQNYERRFA